jgi:protein involved in polysaccharide export with SLBB domain
LKKHTPSPFAASLACIVMLYSSAIRVSAQYPVTLIYSESHSQTQADDEYRIKPKDVLYLEIEGMCIFSPRFNVNDRGMLRVPLIGKVRAADRTVSELENEITEKLKEYLTEPKVYIQVAERATKD